MKSFRYRSFRCYDIFLDAGRSRRYFNIGSNRTTPQMWQAVDIEKWVEERRSGISGVKEPVEDIIRMVREGGDKALFDLTEKFDNISLSELRVSDEEREEAYEKVETRLVESLIGQRHGFLHSTRCHGLKTCGSGRSRPVSHLG